MTKILPGALALLGAFLLLSGCSFSPSRVAVPVDTFPLQLGAGINFLPKGDTDTLVRLSPLWLGEDHVILANLSAVSTSDINSGIALGGIISASEGCGLSAAVVDHNREHLGIRLGGIVCGERQVGLQIGLVTYCTADSKALQIGLLNFSEGSYWPRPLLNWVWGSFDAATGLPTP